jgi:hypothetical protein
MDRINRWKLAEELSVFQIALLIAGYDPSEFTDDNFSRWPQKVRIETSVFITLIKNAIKNDRIQFRETIRDNENYNEIDWEQSTIEINSLRNWMYDRDFNDGFFMSKDNVEEKLFDPKGEFYAPKLAAAVRAWNEVTANPDAVRGKSPKKALEIWLRKHANEYGLSGKDGNPNKLGIEEICKVANWKPNGGANPTPIAANQPTPLVKPSGGFGSWDRKERPKPPIDDDIPF